MVVKRKTAFKSCLNYEASHGGTQNNPSPLAMALNIDASSYLGCSTFGPAPFLLHGKAVVNGRSPWKPVHVWETQKNLLAPGLDLLSCLHGGRLWSESVNTRSLSMSLIIW